MVTHVLTGLFPDRQQDALSLVITGPVGMRFAEVAEGDRTVDGRDDLGQTNVVRRTGQGVPAADTTLGPTSPAPFSARRICSR